MKIKIQNLLATCENETKYLYVHADIERVKINHFEVENNVNSIATLGVKLRF